MIEDFCPAWYLACYPGIGMDPLEHYTLYGRDQGHLPNGYGSGAVDRAWYMKQYPDLEEGIDPAIHYITTGWREGRDPNQDFSTDWYLACYPDLGMHPLIHYITWGRAEGRLPHGRGSGAVDESWYRRRYRDLDPHTDPAVHYAQTGWREGRDPNKGFSTNWYLANNPGIGMNPLIHYLQYGRAEQCKPRPDLRQTIRLGEWLTWKLSPLFAMAYATTVHLDMSVTSVWVPLLTIFAAIAPGAAYASLINDLTDREEDAQAGKLNAMACRSPTQMALLLAGCLLPGAVFLGIWRDDTLLCGSYLAAWVVFSLYSFPPVRLKTRGLWGVIAEAMASGLLPTLVAVLVVYRWSGEPIGGVWILTVGLWSMALGMRGILGHQIVDRGNDILANVTTFAQQHSEKSAQYLIKSCFLFEFIALFTILLEIKSFILFSVTSMYLVTELLIYKKLDIKTVIVPPRGNDHSRYRWALHPYYQIYFMIGVLLQMSLEGSIAIVGVVIFTVIISLVSVKHELAIIYELFIRHYYPKQPVFDRPRRSSSRNRLPAGMA